MYTPTKLTEYLDKYDVFWVKHFQRTLLLKIL